jgi:hypothetical protein
MRKLKFTIEHRAKDKESNNVMKTTINQIVSKKLFECYCSKLIIDNEFNLNDLNISLGEKLGI